MQLNDVFDEKYPHASFHDAEVERISLDYAAKTAVLDCSIYIRDPDAADEEACEGLGKGTLTFQGLFYCAIEPPDSRYINHLADGGVAVDSCRPLDSESISLIGKHLPSNLPDGVFVSCFFVNDWNAFIYIAAEKACFDWLD